MPFFGRKCVALKVQVCLEHLNVFSRVNLREIWICDAQ